MSALKVRANAFKQLKAISSKVGYSHNGNLRLLKTQQLIDLAESLKMAPAMQKKPKVNKTRSAIVKQIKEIYPDFKYKRTDTFEKLNKQFKIKKVAYKASYNKKLETFLSNPIPGNTFNCKAKTFLDNLKHMNHDNSFYLVMQYKTNNETQYKIVSNIADIIKLLNIIKTGFDAQEYSENHGSDTELVYKVLSLDKFITLKWFSTKVQRRAHSGAFFRYLNKSKFNLSKYQIFSFNDKNCSNEICLIYALSQSGLVSKNEIDNLKLSLFDKSVKLSDLNNIAKKLNITIHLRNDIKQREKKINSGCETIIRLGLIDNHFFLNEQTIITKYAIENYESVKDLEGFPSIKNPNNRYSVKWLDSFNVIYLMFKHKDKFFEPLNLNNIIDRECIETLNEYTTLRAPIISSDPNMSYKGNMTIESIKSFINSFDEPKGCEIKDYSIYKRSQLFSGFFNKDKPWKNPNFNYDIWFFDTETGIKTNIHTAFCLCAIKYIYDKETNKEQFIKYEYYGSNCVKEFLSNLERSAILYAHNLSFDFRQLIDFMDDITTPIETGTKLKQIQCKYNYKSFTNDKGEEIKLYHHLLFKDSYSFLPVKLSKIPEMLDLDTGDKEAYPYDLVNTSHYKKHPKAIPLSICCKYLKHRGFNGLGKIFTDNAKKIGAYDFKNHTVDMVKYTIHYCMQDTEILAKGFIKFRKQIQQVCKLDILYMVSLPQLADNFFKTQGVYDDVFSISGIAQDFIRRCCVGGRVMSNSNLKYHVKVFEEEGYTMISTYGKNKPVKIEHLKNKYTDEETKLIINCINTGAISDFDAVSLYPSAMSAMKGYVRGLPKVLDSNQIENFKTIKDSFDAYYLEIEVLSHSINREFPLLSVKDKSGIRKFTNDIDGKRFYVDNICLEDIIEFQGVDYKVIRGYYFNDGFNTKINKVITFMFNERLRLKKEENNLQNVYKLLMNASYGKLIQKAIKTSKVFVKAENLQNYVSRRFKFVDTYAEVNKKLYVVKERKSIIEHFCVPHIAANILSMSKRLMNRVMCLAEDEGLKIYYQDTDSMHLHENAIEVLGKAFKNKYGTELIGKQMCQFHSDFEVSDKKAKHVRSTELIILGKKCYIDELSYENVYNNTKTEFHVRMKGVPTQAVRDYDEDIIETYMKLLKGDSIKFNLANYCPIQIDADYRARKKVDGIDRTLSFKN